MTTALATPPAPASDYQGIIEVIFENATVRVKGCIDRQTLSTVLDQLAPRA